MATGEFRSDLDVDVVLDALYGPIYHRILVPYDSASLTEKFVDRIVDHVFTGVQRTR
jgi:hypothetical protein